MQSKFIIFLMLILMVANSHAELVRYKGEVKFKKRVVLVPAYEEWTFEPNTTVSFIDGAKLVVEGRIRVVGKKGAPIKFHSPSGSWKGIEFKYKNRSLAGKIKYPNFKGIPSFLSFLSNVDIEDIDANGGPAISATSSNVVFNDVRIKSSNGPALFEMDNSEVYIYDSKFLCDDHKWLLNLKQSVAVIDEVSMKGNCKNFANVDSSLAIISNSKLDILGTFLNSNKSHVALTKVNIKADERAIEQNKGEIVILNSEFKPSKKEAFNITRESVTRIRHTKMPDKNEKYCAIKYAVPGELEFYKTPFKENCISVWYDYREMFHEIRETKLVQRIAKWLKEQKAVPYNGKPVWDFYAEFVDIVLLDPEVLTKKISKEDIYEINRLALFGMEPDRPLEICHRRSEKKWTFQIENYDVLIPFKLKLKKHFSWFECGKKRVIYEDVIRQGSAQKGEFFKAYMY